MRRSAMLSGATLLRTSRPFLVRESRVGMTLSTSLSRRAYGDAAHGGDLDTAEPELRIYSRAEVAKHYKEDDCWIIVNNKIYNVSTWADIHPGGAAILAANAGGDATDAWAEIGHTGRARALMKRYLIGKVTEPKRYMGEDALATDLDDSGYKQAPDTPPEDLLEDVSVYRNSTR